RKTPTMRLRLLTYNIHKCIGGVDRRYDLARTAQVIAHLAPDIAFLQEVDALAHRSNGHVQVEELANALGFRHFAFYPNVQVRGGGVYGNALLSRWPLTRVHNLDLT